MRRSTAVALAVALSLALVACGGCAPQAAYVQADRATFALVAPYYLQAVEKDGSLTPGAKNRRRRLISSWELRIRKAEEGIR